MVSKTSSTDPRYNDLDRFIEGQKFEGFHTELVPDTLLELSVDFNPDTLQYTVTVKYKGETHTEEYSKKYKAIEKFNTIAERYSNEEN
jgi:hypothetical protein